MIESIQIENFKSVSRTTLELGRFTVLIGENGCGKSNLLEAVAFSGAVSDANVSNEHLALRGIRTTTTDRMVSMFEASDPPRTWFSFSVCFDGGKRVDFAPKLDQKGAWVDIGASLRKMALDLQRSGGGASLDTSELLKVLAARVEGTPALDDFLIYAPENAALRVFQQEGQILPLGRMGEGLFAYLKSLRASGRLDILREISDSLDLIDWFEGFEVPDDLAPGENSLRIRDRYLTEERVFDQRSANEGFLYLLFYSTLFISPDTPQFFAIDNLDAALNPKLCAAVTRHLVRLAERHQKQVIVTTHNPAILDGLDLRDDGQRLLVVSRNSKGHTRTRRVHPPRPIPGGAPVTLSEAFLRGYIGGLPQNF